MKSKISQLEFDQMNSKADFLLALTNNGIQKDQIEQSIQYEEELKILQIELAKFQQWVIKKNKKIIIIFEGRDAAGKGGSIKRFTEHLNPRSMRVVALKKPSVVEQNQWYFSRYIKELPQPGEIVFFDRSWYNRAVVEPVNDFCTNKQYTTFLTQAPTFENLLNQDGFNIIKLWFSISKKEQFNRFKSREIAPLKRWKISPVDKKGQVLWNKYSSYKAEMFGKTHREFAPWIIIQANNKKVARLESIRYVLSLFKYSSSNRVSNYNSNIVSPYSKNHEVFK